MPPEGGSDFTFEQQERALMLGEWLGEGGGGGDRFLREKGP
jgi:hypothetical protein